MKPKLSAAADADLAEALAYYDEQAPGLADRFLDEFEKALGLIADFPNGWHKLSKIPAGAVCASFLTG